MYVFFGSFSLDARQFGENKDYCYDNEHYGKNGICHAESVYLGLKRACILGSQNYFTQKHGGYKGAQSIESLCQIEAAGRCSRIAQLSDVGVGGCLKEAHTCSYNEKCT
ncbi:MAG: hypothetical protein BWY95_02466 [Bacteroidetes bacterium ADurb.BinA104]|nr:MAG: hypothetical protein BWY95_02466 [Bacteroidetes bacterium ADurb.BinA104]